MNTQKIKLFCWLIGTIACGIGGLFFTAIFAVPALQSWPRALWETSPVLLFSVSSGVVIGFISRHARQWVYLGALAGIFIGLLGSRSFWGGVICAISVEMIMVAELMTVVRRSKRVPSVKANSSLN